jgi:kinesin family protein 1
LVYQIKPGKSTVGGLEHDKAHIKLSGANILPEHCIFTNEDGAVTVEAMRGARTFVNGKRVPPQTPIKLLNGFRVILGDFHVFRFNDPAGARAQREKLRVSSSLGDLNGLTGSPGMTLSYRPDSPARADEMMDWNAARRERADIEKLGDQDLDKLFDDIVGGTVIDCM